MQNLNDLPVSTLKVIAKLATDAMKGRREELGQNKAEFAVDQTVVVRATGTIKVSKSTPDAICAQSARPWALVATLLSELNKERASAGKAGIDMAKVVELAESADPELAKEAQEAADRRIAEIKEPTRMFKWGGVRVAGEVAVLATGDHLAKVAGE